MTPIHRIEMLALLALLATPLALSAQRPARRATPVIVDFPPDWNLDLPRVAGLPRFALDSSYRGWLPLDSMRTMAGGFNFQGEHPVCSDSLGQQTIEGVRGCFDRFYLLIGHPEADGSFFGYIVSDGPVSAYPEPPPPWRWGMTWQKLGRRFTAYPVAGRIGSGRISWVAHYSPGDRQECESVRALEDGRVEGSCRLAASTLSWVPPGGTSRFRLERLRGRPILDP